MRYSSLSMDEVKAWLDCNVNLLSIITILPGDTSRTKEILNLICNEYTNKEIAL
ncbi:hypothetical protein KM914_18685 [Virgibacillus pantothenticus]|uniref:hypothetical protein n=1 Tax=Virgibacillus TaxID=84406 RepID=UPI0012EC2218|nr:MULTISPECIES: hypothetical protein [Virgibacillus]MBS7426683.1 hypothetical protein [Virgibacillus sp. 19R1-5]MBU8568407.1 hypothetical protein [Virgibacillus pantothenticus]MBU8648976.1 hypothetical protein [Virgibacillus pantothenticus]MBU8662747.1 hypothetical protein [Virgibacillus pantothenticus]MBU8674603.1 hypothetical protein [Virgibacillus pantothenticus]